MLALAALLVWRPGNAAAHGVGSREIDPGVTRAMVFLYANGEPMAFAQVQVTAPDGAVYQSARTDGRGGFAFLPSGCGVWRVAASDGQGHRAERQIEMADPGGPAAGLGQGSKDDVPGPESLRAAAEKSVDRLGPSLRDVILGLSLLANLGLGLAFWRLRRRGGGTTVGGATKQPRDAT